MVGLIDEGRSYRFLIDPLLKYQHKKVLMHISPDKRVLDVACGTGALALKIAAKAQHVTGIDLSESMIDLAKSTQQKRKISNAEFRVTDATNLSEFHDNEFDVGVMAMAVHQFPRTVAKQILLEMKRVAKTLVVLDYNHQMSPGFGKTVIYFIEWLAGGEHHRSFLDYMKNRGIYSIIEECGLKIKPDPINRKSLFSLVQCCK
ncbi:MAG: class I SAM-dependent methyltransferase [Fidelibacterota bacterium]